METAARFGSSTEALEALELLKSRGIRAAICPEEATGFRPGMGEFHPLVGYLLQVEEPYFVSARDQLRQSGFLPFDEDVDDEE